MVGLGDVNIVFFELGEDVVLDGLELCFGEVSSPDAGLIGDDEEFVSGLDAFLERGDDGCFKYNILDAMQVVFFLDECTVAV